MAKRKTNYKLQEPNLVTTDAEVFAAPPKETTKGVFVPRDGQLITFPLLQPDFCDALLDEFDAFLEWRKKHGIKPHGPNSMNKYGVLLSELGLNDWVTHVMKHYANPFAKIWLDSRKLIGHYAFLVDYRANKQRALDSHVDTSDVTLNVSLSDQNDYEGGEVVFHLDGEKDNLLTVPHRQGRAILHRGDIEHHAESITRGRRTNLIVWFDAEKAKRRKAKR